MRYYLERVIPIIQRLEGKDLEMLFGRIKPFIKEMHPQEESFSGTLILTDSPEGVSLAKNAGIPCLGIELTEEEPLSCSYVVTAALAARPVYMEQVYRRFYHIPWEIAETGRCILREGTEADVEQILDIYEDIEDFCLTKPFLDVEEGRRYMRDYGEMVYGLYGYGLWVAQEKESGELIGIAGLENQTFQEKEYLALGYVVKKNWRKKGYGEEICRAALQYGREELGVEKLHCFVEGENAGSRRLVEKLGFVFEEFISGETGLCHYIKDCFF